LKKRLIQETDLTTGVVVEEVYLHGNRKHRDPAEGPAWVLRAPVTGIVTKEYYLRHGKYFRQDGPAFVARCEVSGAITHQAWYGSPGKRHRADGPAIRYWNPATGVVYTEEYFRDGYHNRDTREGPAVIARNIEFGHLELEEYRIRGVLHRADGPARLVYDRETGALLSEWYFQRERLFRIGGPATIKYDPVTKVPTEETYFESSDWETPWRDPTHGPTLIKRDGTSGRIILEVYRQAATNFLHRNRVDGPAMIESEPATGRVLAEQYWENGVRVQAPKRSAIPGPVIKPGSREPG
jgi:hypothetical protein